MPHNSEGVIVVINPIIFKEYPSLNDQQREIIEHDAGPLLAIAGPGSGKTYSIVLRTINLLLNNQAKPKELIICTFTEKAAYELRDRISAAALKVGYKGDLSELHISTIHGLCNTILGTYRHRTPLGNNYEVLDELTQLLFIYENFDQIITKSDNDRYLGRWSNKWSAIKYIRNYFNKITEELVDPNIMLNSPTPFIKDLAIAYIAYQRKLFERNRIDFAHQQKIVFDLLTDYQIANTITRNIKYVLVDEYQDTNYIQEQILLKLTSDNQNLCVVGDEDQSLYRFRGATVRNILEFPQRVNNCKIVKLTVNYRSHEKIIAAYDHWMRSINWDNSHGLAFRFEKTIKPDNQIQFPEYPAIFAIRGISERDEAERFADFVDFLKKHDVVCDYSQIALLLSSVRQDHSGHYITALEKKGIHSFCPRARTYFENDEVRMMIGCFALILGYYGDGRGTHQTSTFAGLENYVDDCLILLGRHCGEKHPLSERLRKFIADLDSLKAGETIGFRLADYFYQFLAFDPFISYVKNENRVRNLAIYSQLLNIFQNYYHYGILKKKNLDPIKFHFFNSFIKLLFEGGINEYEDPDQPFPKNHVQIMTIHQSKGLEFPVVVVGSLDKRISSTKVVDRDLERYYHRSRFEPENRITQFDRMRLHYVAFSRPERVLALTAHSQPNYYFAPIWQGLPQWPYVQKDLLKAQHFELKERMPVKNSYSFTGDLKLYETCPRQYQFYRHYDFQPSRSAVIFFGLLVHQTIEEIHRIVLDGDAETLNDDKIKQLFDRTFSFLSTTDIRPISLPAREEAFHQVLNYYQQNRDDIKRVIETEVDVSVEKENYILVGKVDVLMGGDGKLGILDFKTSPKPTESPELITSYERQLCTYAHILEKRYGKRPDRLLLYWTSEKKKGDALMEFPYRPDMVEEAGKEFDKIVCKIQMKEFEISTPPEWHICAECDMKHLCINDRIIPKIE